MRFETGDIILKKSGGPLSKVVQFATKSKYNHVAVVFDYPVIIHAHALGVHLREIQSLGVVDVIRRKYGLSNREKKLLKEVCVNKYLGERYDVSQFIGLGKFFDRKNEFICSELVDELYWDLGYDIILGKSLGKVVPEDISEAEDFNFVKQDVNTNLLKWGG